MRKAWAVNAGRGSYVWRLDVSIWSNRRMDGALPEGSEETSAQPSLALVTPAYDEHGAYLDRLVGLIEYDPAGWQKREGRWLVRYYPVDAADLPGAEDDGVPWRRRHANPDLLATEGEVRNPRDSARDALNLLLDHVKGEVTAELHAAIAKTGPLFLSPLQQMTTAWENKNRPTGSVPRQGGRARA